jgi:hypothetical protein
MARETAKRKGRRWHRLLFVVPFLAMLWVPSYNRLEPALAGIPFFYWYQLLWIVLGAALVGMVYAIERRFGRTERGGDGGPGVPGDIL